MTDTPDSADEAARGQTAEGIVRRGSLTLVGAALGGAMMLGCEILAARFLGVQVYGIYAIAFAVTRIAEILAVFGLHIGILHFLPNQLAADDQAGAKGTVRAALLLPLGLGLLTSAAIWSAAPWLAAQVLDNAAAAAYLRLFALVIPFMCLSEVLATVTRGLGHAAYYVIVRHLVPPGTYLVLLSLLHLLAVDRLWITAAFGTAYVLAFVAGAYFVHRLTSRRWHSIQPRYAFGTLYRYASLILVNGLLYLVIGYTDILMLGSMRSLDETGVYRACLQLVAVFPMITTTLTASVAHVFPVLAQQRRTAELEHAYRTVSQLMISIAITGAVLLAFNRTGLLVLLGPDFAAGALALLFLLCAEFLKCAVGAGAFLLIVSGHQRTETAIAATGMVVNVVLNLLLIPHYGLFGAASATAASHLLMNAIRIFRIRRLLGFQPLRRQVLGAVAAAVLVAGALAMLLDGLGIRDGGGLFELAWRLGLMGTALAAAQWHFGLDDDNRRRIVQLLRGARSAP